MREMKTADLIGPALDWAVADVIGLEEFEGRFGSYWIDRNGANTVGTDVGGHPPTGARAGR